MDGQCVLLLFGHLGEILGFTVGHFLYNVSAAALASTRRNAIPKLTAAVVTASFYTHHTLPPPPPPPAPPFGPGSSSSSSKRIAEGVGGREEKAFWVVEGEEDVGHEVRWLPAGEKTVRGEGWDSRIRTDSWLEM
jgi:hypothetical protein